jgi:SEC-C motif-containing protein
MKKCPCGLDQEYDSCCGRFHSQTAQAPTAETLMRSRYSAFCTKNFEYLKNTTDPQTRAIYARDANNKWANAVEFTRLEVLTANQDTVEFKAHFKLLETGQPHIHHEVSKFRQIEGTWFYREGKVY